MFELRGEPQELSCRNMSELWTSLAGVTLYGSEVISPSWISVSSDSDEKMGGDTTSGAIHRTSSKPSRVFPWSDRL